MRLSDIAQVIRSKNAGPRRLTLDLMFATDADYQRVAQSPALSARDDRCIVSVCRRRR